MRRTPIIVWLCCALCARTWAAETGGPSDPTNLEAARLALGKWVETQQILAKEKREWQQAKDILTARLELVRAEIGSLKEKLARAEGTTTDVDKKKQELLTQTETLTVVGVTMKETVVGLEEQVRVLHGRLPEPLQEKLKPLYDRMPTDSANTKVSLAERYQNVLGILNEVSRLNSEVTMISEVRTLANGKPAEVRTIYVGLGQAYFVSATGEAGIGRPTERGWEWSAAAPSGPAILQAIEILQNKAQPKFIQLPVRIQ